MLFGIDSGDSYDTVVDWLEDLGGVTYTILLDTSQDVLNAYQLNCESAYGPYPRQVIIDREGIVQYTACEYDAARVEEELDALLLESGN